MKILILILLTICVSLFNSQDIVLHEITDKDYEKFDSIYHLQTDEKNKKWVYYILHPELWDKNRDRRISQKELLNAIIETFFMDEKIYSLEKPVIEAIKEKIKQFIISIKASFLNYKQMSYMTTNLKPEHVFDIQDILKVQKSILDKRELENDL